MNERKLYEMSRGENDEAFKYDEFSVEELLNAYQGSRTDRFVKGYKEFYTDIKTSKMVHDEDW